MKCFRASFGIAVLLSGIFTVKLLGQQGAGQPQPAAAEQLFALANQSRAQVGDRPLQWDAALTEAAMKHCRRMAAEGPIAHRYSGEPDLSERTSMAGAHFDLIEENVAVGPYPAGIHEGWMNSPGHRENLLNRDVDHVGIAVVAYHGVLYAVADYSRAVATRTPVQVEAAVAGLIRMSGVAIRRESSQARAACATDHGMPQSGSGPQATFVMRWQDSDLARLPQALVDRLSSGRYHEAEVGSCPSHEAVGAFTSYRIAVLLY